jgi:hypothetical protein
MGITCPMIECPPKGGNSRGPFELIFNEYAFLDYVTETTKYILYLGGVVKMCLRERYFDFT